MDIPDLRELSKLIELCRKKGVESVEIGGMKLVLREEAPVSNYRKKHHGTTDKIESEQLSEDDILTWSVMGDTQDIEQQ